ncbi:PaaI family thioesterase [Mycobacterium sp. NPDC048908]|uniref:PaaI family thioesterase n=1 Tax=Mycobacterium sp. NPDC048908 TaxID=3364292 RepID=UPI00371A5F13
MSHPLNTPLGRFGIVTPEEGPQRFLAAIPAGGMLNPLTGQPTVATLAMLVDHIGGLVNHHRRGPGEWTVSSELSLELAPDALPRLESAPEVPVYATGQPCGPKGRNALSLCELTHRDSVIGTATVRSFYIAAPEHLAAWPDGPTGPLPAGSLADRMAVRIAESGGAAKVLIQDRDPVLNNSLGIVHGGVSAMALELVGSAAVNGGREGPPLQTASLRVNFLRQFRATSGGPQSRYEGTALRLGRSTGVAEALAVDDTGKAAIIARVTAYLG